MSLGILFVFIVLPVLAGLALAVGGLRGRLLLDDPRCARCQYDLTQPTARPTRCPECGADLAVAGSVRFARRVRRPSLIVVGALLTVLALIVGLAGMAFVRASVQRAAAAQAAVQAALATPATGPWAFKSMPTPGLIAAIATEGGEPWLWNELADRLKSNAIDKGEAEAIVARWLEALAGADDAERIPRESWSVQFIEALLKSGQLESATSDEVVLALAGHPALRVPSRVKIGTPVKLSLGRSMGSQSYRRLDRVGEVRLDGVRLEPAESGSGRRPVAPWDAGMPAPIAFDAPGEHTIELDVEWIVVPREGGSGAFNDARAAVLDTPVTDPQELRQRGVLARRKATIAQRITVLDESETIVESVIEPLLRTELRDGVQVTTARVTRRPSGEGLQLELVLDPQLPPKSPPLLVRPVVRIGTQTLRGDPFVRSRQGTGIHTSGTTEWRFDLDDLPPEVTTLQLTLEPDLDNQKLAERTSRAWGEPIVVEKVPVERVDRAGSPAG